MTFSLCEGRSFLHVRFEELVCEMLCEECKHQAGALWVGNELSSHKELLSQNLSVR